MDHASTSAVIDAIILTSTGVVVPDDTRTYMSSVRDAT